MLTFLLRRLASAFILVAIAASMAYVLAAMSLDPRANFEGRNPPPSASVVDRQLDERNLNNQTPVLERYWVWVKGVAQGDFGKTWNGDSVNAELGRRIGVSARLLFVAHDARRRCSACSSVRGARSASTSSATTSSRSARS